MRWPIFAVALLTLAGCNQPGAVPGDAGHGRFVGVGVFAAGQLWSKMAVAPPRTSGQATTADDEHIIVVEDSRTGELRECGDYSGVCASLNPWTRALEGSQVAPVRLTTHAAELRSQVQPPR